VAAGGYAARVKQGPGPIPLAFYVACSWCWCIGMFFPVFLSVDFGWPGWVVFAVPNVIGAASVGFVLRSPEVARRFAERNRWAVAAFGVVTVLFHVSFLCWFPPTPVLFVERWMLAVVVAGLTALFASMPLGRAAIAAIVLWGLSVGFELAAMATGGDAPALTLPPGSGELPALALAWTAPVIAIGFLACPFLDATLLEARERAGDRGRAVFGWGFGLLFPALILITLSYAGRWIVHGRWSYYTYAHVALQASFTMGVHLRALARMGVVRVRPPSPSAAGLAAVAAVVAGATLLAVGAGWAYSGLSGRGVPAPRLVYDVFMSAYGLAFPAVVVCVAWPRSRGRRGSIPALAVVVALGAPMMWLGAIEGIRWWLGLAAGVVALGSLVGWRAGRAGEQEGPTGVAG
jgi:hypothetical protein